MLAAGPRHLHAVLDEYVAHDNRRRPRWARNLRPPGEPGALPENLPMAWPAAGSGTSPIL